MKIYIYSINYWPEETGIGAFTTTRAEYLASVGHDVTVFTTFPYYPEWKVRSGYKGRLFSTEERNGVRVIRSYAYVPERVSSLKRVIHEASFIISSFLRSLGSKRPDLLYVVSPPLGLGASVQFMRLRWRVPYLFEVEDLQPDAAADLNMLPRFVLKAMYRVELMAYRNASKVATLTGGMRERIVEKGIRLESVVLFEPRADESLKDISPGEAKRFRERFNLGDKFIVSHSGNIGIKQGLEVILDTAKLIQFDDSIVFLIVGDGAAKKSIQMRAEQLNLKNVLFLPLLETQDFRGLLGATDIAIVTQKKTVSDIVFPSKTVTYLVAGCPVVASVNERSELARTIAESGAGLVVSPEDPGKLLEGIRNLRSQDLESCRLKAREYALNRWSGARVLGFLNRTVNQCRKENVALESKTAHEECDW